MAVVLILLSGEFLAVAAWPSAGNGALSVRPSSLGTGCACQKGTGEGGRWGLCLDNPQNKTLKAHLRDFGPNTTPGQVLESC